jgi:hypothetical protein
MAFFAIIAGFFFVMWLFFEVSDWAKKANENRQYKQKLLSIKTRFQLDGDAAIIRTRNAIHMLERLDKRIENHEALKPISTFKNIKA